MSTGHTLRLPHILDMEYMGMLASRLVPFFAGLGVVFALLTAPQATAAET